MRPSCPARPWSIPPRRSAAAAAPASSSSSPAAREPLQLGRRARDRDRANIGGRALERVGADAQHVGVAVAARRARSRSSRGPVSVRKSSQISSTIASSPTSRASARSTARSITVASVVPTQRCSTASSACAVERLAQVVVHPGGDAALAVALHRVRGHGDDRRAARRALQAADLGRRGVAVQHRHLAVHQHRRVGLAAQGVDRLAAVGGDVDAVPAAAQDVDRDGLIGRIVLGQQDRCAVGLRARARARAPGPAAPPRSSPSRSRRTGASRAPAWSASRARPGRRACARRWRAGSPSARRRRSRGRPRGRRGRACDGRAARGRTARPAAARARMRSRPSCPPRRGLGPHAPRRQPALEDLAVGRVVVDDQDVEALEVALRRRDAGASRPAGATSNQNVLPCPERARRRRSARPSSPPAGG